MPCDSLKRRKLKQKAKVENGLSHTLVSSAGFKTLLTRIVSVRPAPPYLVYRERPRQLERHLQAGADTRPLFFLS